MLTNLYFLFHFSLLFIQPVGSIVYDFEMMSYNVSEGVTSFDLTLVISSPASIFCNITVNLTATDIEAGMLH